ncbi:MAG: hypothetical protein ACD_30C00081G0013 [uncultured bacterium]|uniref:Uncharacterized protein n=3 Tax=Candidatus Daviesiibacteriota TaxID=1752718 RepID=A0A0G0I2Z8_9BACT|nr:MAG: hypothetical protein ACD_30C00081G0013 [uncultured bacterium]KKQ10486.1 MAG: hypothetical protein US19_C0004G0034 [Candidatus Daviesbacteria bacterium GW2011_GWB1_36_5]KKQ15667.1 MAG: hypothetical protein US28_C0012G0004 [Candidatus Daviesbacteria bacterium GW2011_GWA1_36_8]OGE32609.1 MAG: hypothetical protein A3C99_01945 [Candidatus Daviesbacteria bacterium RIFCSPHIGHO2_02_FULL_37_9]OGE36193.1 MAG: hypothetical protein A3E66_05295 [Candidatus Daviesbacteria bacterium RIFCSPHIGHO2_12_FU
MKEEEPVQRSNSQGNQYEIITVELFMGSIEEGKNSLRYRGPYVEINYSDITFEEHHVVETKLFPRTDQIALNFPTYNEYDKKLKKVYSWKKGGVITVEYVHGLAVGLIIHEAEDAMVEFGFLGSMLSPDKNREMNYYVQEACLDGGRSYPIDELLNPKYYGEYKRHGHN